MGPEERLTYVEMMLEEMMQKLRLYKDPAIRAPSIEQCLLETASHYDVPPHHLIRHYRTREISQIRQIAMFVARTLTTASTLKIGVVFRRDHTSVIHALRKTEELKKENREVAEDIEAIIYKILHHQNGSSIPPDGEPPGAAAGQHRQPEAAAPPIQEGA